MMIQKILAGFSTTTTKFNNKEVLYVFARKSYASNRIFSGIWVNNSLARRPQIYSKHSPPIQHTPLLHSSTSGLAAATAAAMYM